MTQRTQHQPSLTLAQQQQLPPQPQHQVVFNMTPQQTTVPGPQQQLSIDPSLTVYRTTATTPIVTQTNCTTVSSIPVNCPQQQPIIPINATVQQQLPGIGPINIDLGKERKC